MQTYRIHFLLLSSFLLVLFACSPSYRQMQLATGNINKLCQFKPVFKVALYKTEVDVTGNHLSGLLLIKRMPDSSLRMVFSNEIGFKFFDFEFKPNGDFKVYSIIKKMNRKAVLKTLKKDFQLILMENIDSASLSVRKKDGNLYYIVPQKKGYNYYITDSTGSELVCMQRASASKTVVEAIMKNYINGVPDTIGILHKTFDFTIGLKRIEQ
jgi:hypothetical protein